MKNRLGILKKVLIILLAKDTSRIRSLRHIRSIVQPRYIAVLAAAGLAFVMTGMFIAYAQAPSAGTTIGNQMTATFRDGSGVDRSVASNLVETIIQQVASLILTADSAKTAATGNEVIYPHILTNTGNGTDDFNLLLFNNTFAKRDVRQGG